MVNEQLETNGSDEELGIIGPSMGGQVTRYALAYMEEKHAQGVPDMDHNTRVWISFDSPHHGANIPLGNTGLLASLGYSLNQTTAKERFENRVNTNAAQQYLINQAVPRIIQLPLFNYNYIGLYQNNTAPRRIQYINNLTSNGLPGSSGWPQNVKRVAVVNSSDKGVMNGTPGEEAIYIEGRLAGLIPVALFQSFLQVDYNNWNRPLFGAWISNIISYQFSSADLKNDNPPGSIDILPGSKSNSTEAVFNGLVENIEKRAKVTKKRLKPNHTFMPVISALAFNNTNIDWGQRLDDRNLVCTGEIPFDDYLISGTNQSHITITEDIYKYIEYQLINGDVGCSLMCGTYSISGDAQICDGNTNTIHTYTFNGTIANDQTLTWEVTGDLEIDNTTGQTIDVKITTTDGSGEIIAILENDCGDKIKRVFPVAIGTPAIYLSSEFNENGCNFSVTMNSIPFGRIPLSYQWSLDGVNYENGPQTVQTFGFPHRFYGRADWGCGYSTDNIFLEVPEESDCFIEGRMKKISKDQVPKPDWLVYPNPSSNQWNIHIPETAKDSYKLTMFDMGNSVILQQEISKFQSNIEINNTHLSSGLYIIRIQNKTEFITLRALKL